MVCRNFVNCNSRIISTTPSLISTIMQNMNGQANTDKRKKWEPEPSEGLQNFAPLGKVLLVLVKYAFIMSLITDQFVFGHSEQNFLFKDLKDGIKN